MAAVAAVAGAGLASQQGSMEAEWQQWMAQQQELQQKELQEKELQKEGLLHDLLHLQHLLKSPESSEQHQQVLHLIKSIPHLQSAVMDLDMGSKPAIDRHRGRGCKSLYTPTLSI